MRWSAALAVAALTTLGCASKKEYPDTPPVIQGQIDMIVDRLRRETGQEFLSDIRRLVAYDVYAVPKLVELLDERDHRLRSGAAFALGDINDPRVIPALKDHLEDSNEMVRLEIARSLLTRGEWSGIPVLIRGLRSPEAAVRMHCDEALRSQTLKDFSFPVNGSPEDREASIHKWEDWWEKAQQDMRS